VLGEVVAVLADEELAPGRYSKTFSTDAGNLSSGVYIYVLTAGTKTLVNKMMLVK
jgi:hypothetical protein